MQISLSGKKVHYQFEFEGKFNIIVGLSGSKKTTILKTLTKFKNGIRGVTCNVGVDGYKLNKNQIFLFSNDASNLDSYKSIMEKNEGCLFVIDESSDILCDRAVSRVLRESKNYFLIISRAIFGWLPISIDSIYELKPEGNMIVNSPKYAKVNSELTKIGTVDFILTEDSKSSRLFFKHHFDVEVCDGTYVIDGKQITSDNSQLHRILESILNKKKNILVVFDASAYGFYYDLLVATIGQNNVSLLAWDSFESYILSCPMFNIQITKADVKYNYNSVEQLSYDVLRNNLTEYNKSSLPKKLRDSSFIQYPIDGISTKASV